MNISLIDTIKLSEDKSIRYKMNKHCIYYTVYAIQANLKIYICYKLKHGDNKFREIFYRKKIYIDLASVLVVGKDIKKIGSKNAVVEQKFLIQNKKIINTTKYLAPFQIHIEKHVLLMVPTEFIQISNTTI